MSWPAVLDEQLAALRVQYAGRPVATPCLDIVWAPIERVVANDYNPNALTPAAMRYLKLSLQENGLTQPVVAWYDEAADLYVIVDGCHRYKLLRDWFRCNYIPLALVDLPRDGRVVATVIHNRARGKHDVSLTGALVGQLRRDLGWTETQIAHHLALTAEEVTRAYRPRALAESRAHHPYARAWAWHESGQKLYLRQNVREALDERLDHVLDEYGHVAVSVSGGKDSTLLFESAWRKAVARGRSIHAFFLDQEAEYQASIDVVRDLMGRESVIPHWYQVPIDMTNATGREQDMLHAWEPGQAWLRDKDPLAIYDIAGRYPQRFYPFLAWFEREFMRRYGPDACCLIGLRAEESLNRFRVMVKNPGVDGILWSTAARAGRPVRFYPLYDWSADDVFHYFHDENVAYNRIYDWMYTQDTAGRVAQYRVSNLIHEKAYDSLVNLQEFEPETYERLIRRLSGTQTAARYAGETMVYSNDTRPVGFATWRDYRDHLLRTMPADNRRGAFERRFACQPQDEQAYRHQCRQLLLGDWENNLPLPTRAQDAPDWRQKWGNIL